jgi:geranylgeranyl diphosphate synthase type II
METTEFNIQYDAMRVEFEKELASIVPEKELQLYDATRYALSGGGKRIRPMLTLLACGMANDEPHTAMPAAIAIEILHNFTLVHDDIMDNSSTRRGKLTVRKQWNDSIGLLTGDMMIGYAYRALDKITDAAVRDKVNGLLTTALVDVCEGQELDMLSSRQTDYAMPDYLKMIELKTASLMIAAAKMGAICGGADDAMVDAVAEYALNLGLAFQIQDDMLDFTAENIKFGKQVGQDVIEGKVTYPILVALDEATDPKDVDFLHHYCNHPQDFGLGAVNDFIDLFKRLDIFKIGEGRISNYFYEATSALEEQPDYLHKQMLVALLASLDRRIY